MTEQKIKKILKKVSGKVNFRKSTNLVETGILDSMSIMILISEIEKNFNIKINMKKFNIEFVSSVNNIKELIKKNK